MAVAPKHGKATRVFLDEKDVSGFLREVTASASMDPAEITTFTDSDREYIPGLKDGTLSFDGLFAASTTAADDIVNFLDGALGGSTKHIYTVDLTGTTSTSPGGRALMLMADNTAYNITAPLSDVVSVAVDAQGSSGYKGGRIAQRLRTKTSTASTHGGTVSTPGTTSAGGTTGGVIVHYHVTALNSTGTVKPRMQHSTSGSTWASISGTSSTFAGAPGFARIATTGTIKEQVRGALFPSTNLSSVTWAIAFARRRART